MTTRDSLDAGALATEIVPLAGDAAAFAPFTFAKLAARLSPVQDGWIALGALVGGQPAGLALGRILSLPDGGTEGYLMSVMVAKPHRRQGIGVALLDAFMAAAAARGASRLRAVHTDFLPAHAAFEATLARAGWSAPAFMNLRLHWYAGPASAGLSGWKALAGRLFRSGLYRCDPWAPLTEAEQAAIARLKAQPSYQPGMDYDRLAPQADPRISLLLRRGDELVGWVMGAERPERMMDRTTVYYPSAYLDEALWPTGLLMAGYCLATSRQAEVFGPDSIGLFDTYMPRKRSIVHKRLAAHAFRADEYFQSVRPLIPQPETA